MNGYRTIIAAAVGLLAALLREAGIELDEDGLTNSIMILGGLAGAIYYRWSARRNLRGGDLQ